MSNHGSLLLVRNFVRKVAAHWGEDEGKETTKSTAARETFAETGLKVIPIKLLTIFETDYLLYRFELNTVNKSPQIIRPLAVSSVT